MLMNISYKYRMYPNKTQQSFFIKEFGCCRKIWNLLLSDYINNHKIITALSPYKEQYTYLKDTDSNSLCWVYRYFVQSINNYYKIQSRGMPKFKKKHSVQSYTTSRIGNNIRIEYINNKKAYIKLPKISNKGNKMWGDQHNFMNSNDFKRSLRHNLSNQSLDKGIIASTQYEKKMNFNIKKIIKEVKKNYISPYSKKTIANNIQI